MTLQVRVARKAANQLSTAATWWAENRPSAPGAVVKDFGEAVKLLAEQPGIGAEYSGARVVGVRRLYLSRVRYFIYYRATASHLDVLAFWHSRRGNQPVL